MTEKKEMPAYMQLYRKIRSEITDGEYVYGFRLPSKRSMASDTGNSLITVEHAYELLKEEGYIESRQRSGYYVIYRSSEMYEVSDDPQIIPPVRQDDVSDLFPRSVFSSCVRKVLNDYGDEIMRSTEGCGAKILRQAIASYLGRSRDMHVNEDQIVIGSGSEYLYPVIVQILGHHRIYGIEDPSYEKIRQMYRASGVRVDLLKMGENGIRHSELVRTPASVLHVTPYHSFPSGMSADASKRRDYLEWAEKKNAFIVEDDYASEFSPLSTMQETLFAMDRNDHVIYMNTFTRTIGPSMRVGYMVLPGLKTEEFLSKISFRSCTVPTLIQYVIAELLNSGSFERHINRVRRKMRKQVKR